MGIECRYPREDSINTQDIDPYRAKGFAVSYHSLPLLEHDNMTCNYSFAPRRILINCPSRAIIRKEGGKKKKEAEKVFCVST